MIHIPRNIVLRPHGQLTAMHLDGSLEERDVLTCAHCGYTWAVVPGSGRKRGWCRRCSAALCGKPACMAGCLPEEARLEHMERITNP